ncbi:formylglycine-generating enzyme family protein [Tundrisphaera sp. TA3]|uniref:formylglycine-generating enzyme family protein n=1 Tax=Tundrisphaera sp. TA3 TaxID=3435775 RepID=UPI003EBA7E8D
MNRIPRKGLLIAACAVAGLALWFWANLEVIPKPTAFTPSPPGPTSPDPEGPEPSIGPAEADAAGRKRDDNGLRIGFRYCPPGSFQAGKGPRATRIVLDRGFWIGEAEVTQSQWQAVMGTTLRQQRAKDPGQPRPVGDGSMREHVGEGPDHPIYFVSQPEAQEFCRRLTGTERASGRLAPGLEFRLPTEAQWEYACRAGTTTATAFGDRLGGDDANIDGTKPYGGAKPGPYVKETTPAGRYRANAWGVQDMHGNVWEWCGDSTGGEARPAARGGCWHNSGVQCLSTSRFESDPDTRGSGLGFRVALVVAKS